MISSKNRNDEFLKQLENADWIGISVVSYLEFLSFSGISDNDVDLFLKFIQQIEVIDLKIRNKNLIKLIIENRVNHKLKLPDAIILATAQFMNSKLLTRDKKLVNTQI